MDAIGVRPGSAAIVIGNLLHGWRQAAPGDELILLADGEFRVAIPPGVSIRTLTHRTGVPARIWAQSVGVRLACRKFGADVLLSAVTAGALLGARCPSGAIVYDLRHEQRPAQFSRLRRLVRRVSYGWTFRRADALFCISERTRGDLIRRRPRLASKAHATLLGSDHAACWKPRAPFDRKYVLAFGHFANKNLEAVLRAWARFDGDPTLRLRVCGLSGDGRAPATELIGELGIADRVELSGWLSDEQFEAAFAGAAAIVFPSDFEGFGLPVVEALLLAIPVVISADPALAEVSGGHAVTAADLRPDTLARAIADALRRTDGERAAGVAHARTLTWSRMAREVRQILTDASRT